MSAESELAAHALVHLTKLSSSWFAPSYSHFGVAFVEAKIRSNARTRHGTFDTSVVEVNKEDLTSFLEELQLG